MTKSKKPESNELIGVCVILQDKGGRVLLGKRKNSYRAGFYGLPGGRVERDESLSDGAIRELHEETGLKVDKLKYLGVVRDLQEQNHTFIHFAFLCNEYSGLPKVTEPEKCEGWEWFEPSQIPDQTLPGHKGAVDLLLNPDLSNIREVSSI